MTNKLKTLISLAVFLLLLIISFGLFYNNWDNKHRGHINSQVSLGKIDLSGLTIDQAEVIINKETDHLESTGITIIYNNQQLTLPSVVAANTDLSFPVFIFDREQTLEELANNGPKDSFISYLKNYVINSFSDTKLAMAYSLDKERARLFILENLKDVEVPAQNATFTVKKNGGSEVNFYIEPEKIGRQIDFDLAYQAIENNIKQLSNNPVSLKTITARPTVYTDNLTSLKPEAEALISQGDLKVTASTTASSTTWTIPKGIIASWITSEGEYSNFRLSLDLAKISDYLKEYIAPSIDQEAKTPRYEIKNGKLINWQNGADGQALNLANSAMNIKDKYLINSNNQADLVIDIKQRVVDENTDNFNIQEIIGTGYSNFAGSPANRIHNIKIGAEAVNGMLIPAGEEFSLVKTLGEIDASTGYLPELVIKDNKTIPEYGGGLCQVATTIFRGALDSGLPITARQNHSYRVSYYEPAGTDAAVYDPWPDVRFLNDSGSYILIQTRIVKNEIWFDFWGKSDGRIVTSTTPVVYNITKPAPTKIIETDDLKPGEKKCTEHAHNGADAYFDYTVIYASGDEKSTRFKSHYVPWQEVCLVGKSATSTVISTDSHLSTTTININ